MPLATQVEADHEYARNVGQFETDRAWILAPTDAWYRNPYYSGPPMPHPEDEEYGEYGYGEFPYPGHPEFIGPVAPIDDEIPF